MNVVDGSGIELDATLARRAQSQRTSTPPQNDYGAASRRRCFRLSDLGGAIFQPSAVCAECDADAIGRQARDRWPLTGGDDTARGWIRHSGPRGPLLNCHHAIIVGVTWQWRVSD
jgi:hypothetical protein